ncbi:right-handed parallel beta-helix repeat-containing protein [Tenacibaculum jejuense]|uniref:Probable lipoprotein n=1 Tax=Tenacibaculum jejuense TaxID=584609 RepID=A0A238U8J4_9FLAO|nr:right-handed parallel beta-helix repeat-containing protein [Tenacibaculum jejuense]SNR14814.1 Probable lipoprotein precursor [Tenacibaculum jejuense]
MDKININFKLYLVLLITCFSCSKDEVINVGQEGEDGNTPDEVINTQPCDFKLTNLSSNSKKTIDCTLDLQGETVSIPDGVELVFNKGKIINGKLNFTSNGIIDSRLLTSSVSISGDVSLKNNYFNFLPDNWNIIQGKVSDEIANTNKENLQKVIDLSKDLGATTFVIDKLDAYFKIGIEQGGRGLDKDAIHLPSDFHLKMTNDTFLRVQPFKIPWGVLISVFEKNNVTITGGNLIGDRFEHDYSPYKDAHGISRDTHEWPTLITIAGSENIQVNRTNLKASTGDCIVIGAVGDEGSRTNPNALWNKKISIENCVIDEGRRNNISITDGEDITIKNNQIKNTGLGEVLRDDNGNIIYNSSGTNPKYGIDIEPYIEYSSFNFDSAIKYEWVENVSIDNNTFTNNQNGSIIVFTGDKVNINGNVSDHSIAQRHTRRSSITNNTIEARDNVKGTRIGIQTSDFRLYTDFVGGNLQQYAIENHVGNNTVKGFATGMKVFGGRANISQNKVIDCKVGLIIEKAEDVEVFDNTYTSIEPNSAGIIFGVYSNNIKIHDEKVDVEGRFLFVNGFNRPIPNLTNDFSSYTTEISRCVLNGKKTSRIFNAVGISLINNTINTGLEIIKSDRIKFNQNTIDAKNVTGVIVDESINSTIINNNFTLTDSYELIEMKNIPSGANNTVSGNTRN